MIMRAYICDALYTEFGFYRRKTTFVVQTSAASIFPRFVIPPIRPPPLHRKHVDAFQLLRRALAKGSLMSAGALYSPRLVVVSKASAHAVPGHSAFLPRHRTTRFEQLNDSNLTTTAQSRSCFGEKMQFLIRSCNGLLPQEPAKHFLEHIQHMLSLMLLFWRPMHGIAQ